MLPDFLMIGATQCGTTSLHRYLLDHPDVFIHPVKELRYFTTPHNWYRGPDWYRAQFKGAGDARAVGEATDAYTRYPIYNGVPQRIAALLPNVRMIYLGRNPIARIESLYRYRRATGGEWRQPEQALRANPSYIAASLYGKQLKNYRRHFKPDQILFVQSEDLFARPKPVLREICEFLGVDVERGGDLPLLDEIATRPVAADRLRSFSRFRLVKSRIKRVIQWTRRHGLWARGIKADQPAFALSEPHQAELREYFEQDRRLLEELTGQRVDWDLDAWPRGERDASRQPPEPLLNIHRPLQTTTD